MARKKKLRKVDTVTYSKTGDSVDIMFNPNADSLTFSFKYAGNVHQCDKAAELKKLAYNVLVEAASFEWIPEITVRVLSVFGNIRGNTSFVGFSIDRRYIAVRNDGNLQVLRWIDYDPESPSFSVVGTRTVPVANLSKFEHWHTDGYGDFTLPIVEERRTDRPTYHLPYTEEAWAGLNELQAGIRRLRDKLWELMGTDEGNKMLYQVGAQMMRLLPETVSAE